MELLGALEELVLLSLRSIGTCRIKDIEQLMRYCGKESTISNIYATLRRLKVKRLVREINSSNKPVFEITTEGIVKLKESEDTRLLICNVESIGTTKVKST